MNELWENPLFNITFFGGLIFAVTGFFMFQFPPKKINFLYGYRTVSSMKDQERWDFAQKYSAKEMMKLGGFLTLSSVLVFITDFTATANLVLGLFLMILVVIILLIRVETAIKRRFRN